MAPKPTTTTTVPDPGADQIARIRASGKTPVTTPAGSSTDPNVPGYATVVGDQPISPVVVPQGATYQTAGAPGPFGQLTTPLTWTQYGVQARPDYTTPYKDSNAWDPANDPGNIPAMQQKMIAAGLVAKNKVTFGRWDNTMATAYKSVLSFANATGMSADDALNTMTQLGAPEKMPGSSRTRRLEDPSRVEAAYQSAAQQLLGHTLPEAQAAAFAKEINAQEIAAGTLYGTPDVSAEAAAQIQQQFPAQSKAYGLAGRMTEFFGMLNAPVQVSNPK